MWTKGKRNTLRWHGISIIFFSTVQKKGSAISSMYTVCWLLSSVTSRCEIQPLTFRCCVPEICFGKKHHIEETPFHSMYRCFSVSILSFFNPVLAYLVQALHRHETPSSVIIIPYLDLQSPHKFSKIVQTYFFYSFFSSLLGCLFFLHGICLLYTCDCVPLEQDPSYLGAFLSNLYRVVQNHVHVFIKADDLSFQLHLGILV